MTLLDQRKIRETIDALDNQQAEPTGEPGREPTDSEVKNAIEQNPVNKEKTPKTDPSWKIKK